MPINQSLGISLQFLLIVIHGDFPGISRGSCVVPFFQGQDKLVKPVTKMLGDDIFER